MSVSLTVSEMKFISTKRHCPTRVRQTIKGKCEQLRAGQAHTPRNTQFELSEYI